VVYVNWAAALDVAATACTDSVGPAAAGITTSTAKNPDALAVKAALAIPALTVPALFLGNPVPVTLTVVPAGPELGLRLMEAAAAWAGAPVIGR
jgi:hypothetical protein